MEYQGRYDFTRRLQNLLADLEDRDVAQGVLKIYDQKIDEGLAKGMTEEDLVKTFERPEDIAEDYRVKLERGKTRKSFFINEEGKVDPEVHVKKGLNGWWVMIVVVIIYILMKVFK